MLNPDIVNSSVRELDFIIRGLGSEKIPRTFLLYGPNIHFKEWQMCPLGSSPEPYIQKNLGVLSILPELAGKIGQFTNQIHHFEGIVLQNLET